MHSLNIVNDNIEKIRSIFPNCVVQSKDESNQDAFVIDFELLKQELSPSLVEGPQERYHLNWPGKRDALLLSNAPISKAFRPNRTESVDFDSTKNIFIEGDNLDALKLLQESYVNKVKLIYIDPPYNTGSDLIYEDDFSQDSDEYLKNTGQKDTSGNKLIVNMESNGKFHSDWITMMYSRLKLARNLLSDDGVAFISIDDNEVINLSKICNEIYGENNVDILVWNKEAEGKSGTLKQTLRFRRMHEYIIVAYKNKFLTSFNQISEALKGREDEFQTANLAVNEDSAKKEHANVYTVKSPAGVEWTKHWKVSKQEFNEFEKQELIYWGKDGHNQPRRILPTDDRRKVFATSIINRGGTTVGRKDYEEVMPPETFSYPKPINLIKQLLEMTVKDGDYVLDFFAGSGTTAHALFDFVAKFNINLKFILVQIPEPTETESSAYKNGFVSIAEITKERIRKAGIKIKNEYPESERSSSFDFGFRVLKIDDSNMKEIYYRPDDLTQKSLFEQVENIKSNRTHEDLVFQVMHDWGLELNLPIKVVALDKKSVYLVDDNSLAACFEDEITEELVHKIAERKPYRVVFKEAGFASDSIKINTEQIFKLKSPDTEIKTI